HDVRLDAGRLIGEQLAGTANAGLHLVEDQQQMVLVTEPAQRLQELWGHRAHAAFALDRLDQDRGGCWVHGRLVLREVERHLIEAVDHRPEAVEMLLLTASRERRQRAAMERALESDDAVALRVAARRLVLTRHLYGALHRFGARIGEEDELRKARRAQALGKLFAVRHLEEIGDVPDALRLLGQRRNKMRMGVAERVDRNAGSEIEIARSISCGQPSAFASLESKIDPWIGG